MSHNWPKISFKSSTFTYTYYLEHDRQLSLSPINLIYIYIQYPEVIAAFIALLQHLFEQVPADFDYRVLYGNLGCDFQNRKYLQNLLTCSEDITRHCVSFDDILTYCVVP